MLYIIGAGPGDPDLISIKAIKIIQKSNVILIDRLVSKDIIKNYALPSAKIIYVGKHGANNSISQKEINDLLVEYGTKNLIITRLKGGDISIFSNILDELIVLKENNIKYELIPGISSFLGAAAYSAIPLTARGLSKGIRLITTYDFENIKKTQWKDWVKTDDTLIFYMSGQKANQIIQKFIDFNVSNKKSIAIITQATTSEQKTNIFSFNDIDMISEFQQIPTLIIIGKTVFLHNKFKWFKEKGYAEPYFDNKFP